MNSDGMIRRLPRSTSLLPVLTSGAIATICASIASTKPVQMNWFSAIAHLIIFLLPAAWGAFLFVFAVNRVFKSNKDLIKKYYWRIMSVASFLGITLASLLVPIDVFAQRVATGGGTSGKCSSLAFLQAMGNLTQNTFSGLASGSSSTGGASFDLASQACGLLLLFVWLIVFICFIGCISTARDLYDNQGRGWGQAGQNLIIPVFFLVSVFSVFTMFGIA